MSPALRSYLLVKARWLGEKPDIRPYRRDAPGLSGLISSTILGTVVTPVLFWRFGRPVAERILAEKEHPRAD